MKRNVSLDEISDGKLYEAGDMVKADCGDCKGCSACCHGMGNSIILDPLDVHRLSLALGKGLEELMQREIELNIVDGVILPNLKMTGDEEACAFLNGEGRCSIHAHRPGICRLFPLGRYYENHDFRYFLQVHECPKENKSKIKVKKWVDTPNLKQYERFVVRWHYFLNACEERMKEALADDQLKEVAMYVLQQFYVKAYDGEKDFYEQFEERMEEAEAMLGL